MFRACTASTAAFIASSYMHRMDSAAAAATTAAGAGSTTGEQAKSDEDDKKEEAEVEATEDVFAVL